MLKYSKKKDISHRICAFESVFVVVKPLYNITKIFYVHVCVFTGLWSISGSKM